MDLKFGYRRVFDGCEQTCLRGFVNGLINS